MAPYYFTNPDTIGFGQYEKHSVSQVIFKNPNYIQWILSCPLKTGKMEIAADNARELIDIFNSKPYVKKCRDCKKQSQKCYVYNDTTMLYFLCKECNIYSAGKFVEIKTYDDIIQYARSYWKGKTKNTKYVKKLIYSLARAKGLPGNADKNRPNKGQISEFFAHHNSDDDIVI